MAVFVCPKCKKTQGAPDPYIGRTAKCLKCGAHGEITKEMPKVDPNNPPSSSPPLNTEVNSSRIEQPAVATLLTVVAVLELIAAPIAGLGIGEKDTMIGWVFFVSGFVSGLILLGFAQVIARTSETAQRLQRIEILLANGRIKIIGEQSGEREPPETRDLK